MNKSLAGLGALLLLSGGFSCLHAQSTPDGAKVPEPPYLVPPAERAAWTVTVAPAKSTGTPAPSPDGSSAKSPPSIVRQEIVQTGKLRRETSNWSNGGTSTDWVLDNYRFQEDPTTHAITLIDFRRNFLLAFDRAKFDFAAVNWLAPQYYLGTVTENGQSCHHYLRKVEAKASAPGTDSELQLMKTINDRSGEAWVDAKTRQLVAYEMGGMHFSIVFGAPPDADLVLPDDLKKRLQKHLDDLNPLKVPAPPRN